MNHQNNRLERPVSAAISVPPIQGVDVRPVTGTVVMNLITDDHWRPVTLYIEPRQARELAAQLLAVAEQVEAEATEPTSDKPGEQS